LGTLVARAKHRLSGRFFSRATREKKEKKKGKGKKKERERREKGI
jgi:hypothetical protein